MAANSIQPLCHVDHRGDRTKPMRVKSGKLAGIAHRDAKQKDNREGSRLLLVSVPAPGCSQSGERIWRISKWRWFFGRTRAQPKAVEPPRETECGEEEKCKTMSKTSSANI